MLSDFVLGVIAGAVGLFLIQVVCLAVCWWVLIEFDTVCNAVDAERHHDYPRCEGL